MAANMQPNSVPGPIEQVQSRVQSFVHSIPAQTFGLLSICTGFAILDMLSMDLISQGLTLERSHRQGNGDTSSMATVMILTLLSPFSPLHGLFSVLLSIYFGKDILSGAELECKVPAYFLPTLFIKLMAINVGTLLFDNAWYLTFPTGWARIAVSGGFAGLFPLICCLEAEKSVRDPSAAVDLSFLPFAIPRRFKPIVLAFGFSIIGGGDIDLFVACVVGYSATLLGNVSPALQRFMTSSRHGVASVEESSQLLPSRQPNDTVEHPKGSSNLTEQERRALLLSAAEKRLAETRPLPTSNLV